MSFTHLSGSSVILGALALAGLAFLLQRLRVRHRELVVPTTLFWREALERSEARKLQERFRHPWTFALVLGILLLLWLALAGPTPSSARGPHYLLLVDGGAAMGRTLDGTPAGPSGQADEAGTLLVRALDRAEELAASLPRERTRVVLTGALPRTLLGAGEPTELLEHRRADLTADAAPGDLAGALLDLLAARAAGLEPFGAGEDLTVLLLGEPDLAPGPDGLLPALERCGAGTRVARVSLEPGAVDTNDGLLALGLAPAASGAWDRVDLWLATSGPAPGLAIDGRLVDPLELRAASAAETLPGRTGFWLRDVEASGGRVVAELSPRSQGDALALDDRAELVLPRRERLRVSLDPALPAPEAALLAAAVDADLGLERLPAERSAEADVAVLFTPPGPTPALDRPSLLVTEAPAASGTPRFEAARPAGRPSFLPVFEALALDQLGTDLAATGASAPAGPAPRAEEGPTDGPASLSLDARLLAPPYDLAEGRALPLLLGLGLRWLAGDEQLLPTVAVGRDLWSGERDNLGLVQRPRRAGEVELAGRVQHASLFDAATTLGATPTAGLADLDPGSLPAGSDPDRTTPLALLALALLVLEWFFFRTRRMP